MKRFLNILLVFAIALAIAPVEAKVQQSNNKATVIKTVKNNPKSIDAFVGNYDKKIKIIFSDIDETMFHLNPNKKGIEISDSTKKAIKKLEKANITLVLATGRSYYEAKSIVDEMGCKKSYIISNQAAEITNPKGKIIYRDPIENKDVKKMLSYLEAYKKTNNSTMKEFVFIEAKPYSTENIILPYKWEPLTVVKSYDKAVKNYNASKILIYEPDTNKLKKIQADFKKEFPDYSVVLGTEWFCEINSPTATKANGIRIVAEILNEDLANSAALGDSENDVSMFKEVRNSGGVTIVVANGMEKAKENADYITSSVTEDGFAKAVDKILENNARLDFKK